MRIRRWLLRQDSYSHSNNHGTFRRFLSARPTLILAVHRDAVIILPFFDRDDLMRRLADGVDAVLRL